jgi:hypothetical protein
MLYVLDVAIPPSTPVDSAIQYVLPMTAGTITKVMIMFPPGCCGLVGVSIRRSLLQLWPSQGDAWFFADGETITWEEEYELDTDPYQLEVYGISNDDTFVHDVRVRFVLEPAEQEQSILNQVKKILGVGGS